MSQYTSEYFTIEAQEKLQKAIDERKSDPGVLMHVLHVAQDTLGFIPYEVQSFIAEKLNVSLAEVYGVVTFYSRFTVNPVGKYKIGVCLGTACYVKGSDKILEKVENILGIKAGETSEDGLYSIEATRCIGACGLAPVMTVNEDVYGKLIPEDIDNILAKYK